MSKARTHSLKNQPILSFVPRSTVNVLPLHEDQTLVAVRSNHSPYENQSSVLSQSPKVVRKIVPSSNDKKNHITTPKTNTAPAAFANQLEVLSIDKEYKSSLTKQLPHKTRCNCFNQLTNGKKTCLILTIISILFMSTIVAILLPFGYLFMKHRTNLLTSMVHITTPIRSMTSCIGKETPYRSTTNTVIYPFDGNLHDLTGYATGTAFGPTKITFTANCYVGTGALNLTNSSSQYIQIPNMNLTQQSFTIEVWMLPNISNYTNDHGIFSQCDSNFQCVSVSLRNYHVLFKLDSINTSTTLISSSVIVNSKWVNLAVVYDFELRQQRIYINGYLDAVSVDFIDAYNGSTSGLVTLVGIKSFGTNETTYFTGLIDHLMISIGIARTACQILNDATLTAYYPFDTIDTFNDYSVNHFNGLASEVTLLSQGYVRQALQFSSNSSYFHTSGFPSINNSDSSFTLSLWVNPSTSTHGGTLVHISSALHISQTYCYDLLAFTSTGELVYQLLEMNLTVNSIKCTTVPKDSWSHILAMYDQKNNMRLYVNGSLCSFSSNSTGSNIYRSDHPLLVTLGTNDPISSIPSNLCQKGHLPIASGPFTGALDELRIYNRDLNIAETLTLANRQQKDYR